MSSQPFIVIPTNDRGTWGTTSFESRDDFKEFVLGLFKLPGEYGFDETVLLFQEQGIIFRKQGFYCDASRNSRDYITYWDGEKDKCRKGAIFISDNGTWYLPRAYYMWINFLQVNNKVKRKFDFPDVWDSQYHAALYILLAELHYKHSTTLKKRQWGGTYYHLAILANTLWFEETPILKIGASLKDYVNEKGAWRFIDEYRNFLDKNTAWYRPMNPGKVGIWQQQIEVTKDDRKTKKGLKGVLQMTTFEKDPTAGVGGACTYFYHEEFGIAPKADVTLEFLLPALKLGGITTGTFMGSGSVGDLDQCEPLRACLMNPEANDMYPVETNLIDDKGTVGLTALFIPEQWSMPPFIDRWGNSDVLGAEKHIDEERIIWKRDLTPEIYQLRISQHPKNIEEAFAFRKESLFPVHLLLAQKRRIEQKTYPYELVDIYKNAEGKIVYKQSNKLPINEFPLSKKTENKEGCIIMWERPVENPAFQSYYASIDPVGEGRTTTSESLCSIYIYKNDVEVTRVENGEGKTSIESGKIVAAWCGRFDDLNKTHERLELIIELYNAWAVVENNIAHFILYMISKHKQKYLVPKSELLFLKDLGANTNVFQEYGWKNTGILFKKHLLNYGIEFLKEEIDHEIKPDGEVVKTTFGIERIPDSMLITEMEAYNDDVNVDRLVSYCALIAFVKVQQANRGFKKRVDHVGTPPKQDPNLYKKSMDMFRHMGKSNNSGGSLKPDRNPFKNLR